MMGIREMINKKRYKIQNIGTPPLNIQQTQTPVSNESSLLLTSERARTLLRKWADDYIKVKEFDDPLTISFDPDLSVTRAETLREIDLSDVESHKAQIITIGIKELFTQTDDAYVKDMDFIKAAIALYHEIAHYEDNVTSSKTKEDLISEFSTYGNKNYYFKNWPVFHYEIKAERKGVMSAWGRMKQVWPDKDNEHSLVDDLMLKRLTERSLKSGYMIEIPDYDPKDSSKNCFQSKDQANTLFNEALEQSNNKRRYLSDDFFTCDDEIAQMIAIRPGLYHPGYYPFYASLVNETSGPMFDKKMASLVAYLHPDRKNLYPELDFDELIPEKLFGMSVPETKEEILKRITHQSEEDIFCSIEELSEEWDSKQIGREMEEALKQMDIPEPMAL